MHRLTTIAVACVASCWHDPFVPSPPAASVFMTVRAAPTSLAKRSPACEKALGEKVQVMDTSDLCSFALPDLDAWSWCAFTAEQAENILMREWVNMIYYACEIDPDAVGPVRR